MSLSRNRKVLAIAIDAAEPTLVRQMIEQRELPALASLLSQGQWLKVEAPAGIGSGAVWPTFITGTDPAVHGIYGEWIWQPGSMRLSRYLGRDLVPFWKTLADDNTPVGLLDLPFMPVLGLRAGFEISEWAPHDVLEGHMQVAPENIRAIVSNSPSHPLSTDQLRSMRASLEVLASGCLEGIRLRGELARDLLRATQPRLAIVSFTEIHRTGHFLWHTVEPDHEVYAEGGIENLPAGLNLKTLLREVDRQIAGIADSCGPDTTVLVFSLHGMRPARGAPAFLGPLLCELGFARLAGWGQQSWRERATTLMAGVKRRSPSALKNIYYRNLPAATTQRLARPTMMPAYDWEQTRAFSLPTDQHGWIRVNLAEREARGSVSLAEYDGLRDELETSLRSLTTEAGQPLVREVVRTSDGSEAALASRLPDLIVHWEDAVFDSPLRIKGSLVNPTSVGKYTGQHSLEGFCICNHSDEWATGGVVAAKDLGRLMTASLQIR
ncbi:MAG TPA: alkaline phosphatase family protein [Pyrinomonadaceae bacterium]